jgi:hypothetical protein
MIRLNTEDFVRTLKNDLIVFNINQAPTILRKNKIIPRTFYQEQKAKKRLPEYITGFIA